MEIKKGTWVEYDDGFNELECGRVKGHNKDFVFVVYHCDNDWRNYEKYTAEATHPSHLRLMSRKEVQQFKAQL